MGNLSGFVKRLRDIMRNDAGINGDAQRIEQIAWMLFLKVYDTKEQDWEMDDSDYRSIIPAPCCWSNWAYDDKSGSVMTGDTLPEDSRAKTMSDHLMPVSRDRAKMFPRLHMLLLFLSVSGLSVTLYETVRSDGSASLPDLTVLWKPKHFLPQLPN